jgi:hypothetical protein
MGLVLERILRVVDRTVRCLAVTQKQAIGLGGSSPSLPTTLITKEISMTSITFCNQHGNFTISLPKDDMNLNEVMQELIKPVLLAATYQPENINEYIPDE